MAAPKKWTEEQDNILRELYRNHTCKELEPILNHPYRAIETRAYKLGLCKDKQWKLERSRATAFKKGHVPHSKGKTWDQMFTPRAAGTHAGKHLQERPYRTQQKTSRIRIQEA